MRECRYWPRCKDEAWCDGKGALEGLAEGARCKRYRPMPDVDALLALADELEEDARWEVQTPDDTNGAWRLKDTCDRIREALGVES